MRFVVGGRELKFEGETGLFFLKIGDELFHFTDGFPEGALRGEGGLAALIFRLFFVPGFEEPDRFGGGGREDFADAGISQAFSGDEGSAARSLIGFVQVVLIVAGVGREFPGANVEHGGRELADEVDIMTDEDKGAGEGLHGPDEGINTGHVQVRGRLIHEEEIWRIEEELAEGES